MLSALEETRQKMGLSPEQSQKIIRQATSQQAASALAVRAAVRKVAFKQSVLLVLAAPLQCAVVKGCLASLDRAADYLSQPAAPATHACTPLG